MLEISEKGYEKIRKFVKFDKAWMPVLREYHQAQLESYQLHDA